jgi:AraC family transcriptional activator of pobA
MENRVEEILLIENIQKGLELEKYFESHFLHILGQKGKGHFRIGDKTWSISKNDIAILLPNEKIQELSFEPDFKGIFLLVSFDLMSKNNPDIGWGIKGFLFSKENPVVSLGRVRAQRCSHNFRILHEKYQDYDHRFRTEIINLQLKIFIMEMWDLFAEEIEQQVKSSESKSLFQRFLQLVQINCMEEREVEFYADQLAITPKYLSEVCKKSSGKNASDWIQNYTTTRLILLLRNENLSFSEIADTMNFSSLSFFSRYVKKLLGVSPSKYRQQIG